MNECCVKQFPTKKIIWHFFRWLKPLFSISWKRPIDENDIDAPLNSLRCKENTEAFAEQWELELKKKNPSILRVMMKLYMFEVLSIGTLLATCESLAR